MTTARTILTAILTVLAAGQALAQGMPIGSPGMDFGDDRKAVDVFLIGRDGTTEVFSSYPGN